MVQVGLYSTKGLGYCCLHLVRDARVRGVSGVSESEWFACANTFCARPACWLLSSGRPSLSRTKLGITVQCINDTYSESRDLCVSSSFPIHLTEHIVF